MGLYDGISLIFTEYYHALYCKILNTFGLPKQNSVKTVILNTLFLTKNDV